MNRNKTVAPIFNKQYKLNLNNYTGGTVEVRQGGSVLTKGADGYGPFNEGTMVTIKAIPTPTSWRLAQTNIFGSWSGDASGNTTQLTISMSGNKSVTAIFNKTQCRLIINNHPYNTGTGTVEVKEGNNILTGISGDYGLIDIDTVVTLTATSDGGSVFSD
jgi:hypothetical protein